MKMSFDEECGRDEIGHCVPKEGTGGACGGLSKTRCRSKSRVCEWECMVCPPDKTQNEEILLINLIPGGKMPFNEPQKEIQRKCNILAKQLKDMCVPFQKATRMITYAYSGNIPDEDDPKPSSNWDAQRNKCLNGLRKVYERKLKKPVWENGEIAKFKEI